MTLDQLVPYIAGPGGAIVICCLVGWGVYRLLVHYFVPLVEGAVNRHLDQVDRMVEKHSEEHAAIIKALQDIKPCGYDEAAK